MKNENLFLPYFHLDHLMFEENEDRVTSAAIMNMFYSTNEAYRPTTQSMFYFKFLIQEVVKLYLIELKSKIEKIFHLLHYFLVDYALENS